jgi:hypothetical protein
MSGPVKDGACFVCRQSIPRPQAITLNNPASRNAGKSRTEWYQRRVIRWIVGFVLVAQTYALVRYGVFKGVSLEHWPLYLNNKAISLAGLCLLAASFIFRRTTIESDSASSDRSPGALLARAGFALIGLHVLMSLPILGPGYFPQFFTGDKMNLTGELSLLLGVISFGCCLGFAGLILTGAVMNPTPAWRILVQRLAAAVLVTAAGHVLVMGVAGWLTPDKWPGKMPPITLIAFLTALVPLLWRARYHDRPDWDT